MLNRKKLFLIFFTLNGLLSGLMYGLILGSLGVTLAHVFDPLVIFFALIYAIITYPLDKRLAEWQAKTWRL